MKHTLIAIALLLTLQANGQTLSNPKRDSIYKAHMNSLVWRDFSDSSPKSDTTHIVDSIVCAKYSELLAIQKLCDNELANEYISPNAYTFYFTMKHILYMLFNPKNNK